MPQHRELWAHYRQLIYLRRDYPALASGNLRVLVADQNDLVLAFLRWSDDDDSAQAQVLIIANLQDKPLAHITFTDTRVADGEWRDALSRTVVSVQDHVITISLAPSQVMVLVRADKVVRGRWLMSMITAFATPPIPANLGAIGSMPPDTPPCFLLHALFGVKIAQIQ